MPKPLKMTEIWKDIPGYEGLYRISNLGNFYGVKSGRLLHISDTSRGYKSIQVCKENVVKYIRLHKAVMLAFVGPYPEGMEINHIDSNKKNNRLDNLEYCTRSHNILHRNSSGSMDGKWSMHLKGRLGNLNHNSKKIIQMDKELGIIKTRDSLSDVHRETGISIGLLSRVIKKGTNYCAGGYKWKFV